MITGCPASSSSLHATNGFTPFTRSAEGSSRVETKERTTSGSSHVFRVQGYTTTLEKSALKLVVYVLLYLLKIHTFYQQFPEETKGKEVYKNELR